MASASKSIDKPFRHRPFRARLIPGSARRREQRERREAGERRRLAAVGEALGADEIFGHRAEDQREGIDDQVGVPRDGERIDERFTREVARRVRRDGEGDDRQRQRDPDRRDAGARPFARRRRTPRSRDRGSGTAPRADLSPSDRPAFAWDRPPPRPRPEAPRSGLEGRHSSSQGRRSMLDHPSRPALGRKTPVANDGLWRQDEGLAHRQAAARHRPISLSAAR